MMLIKNDFDVALPIEKVWAFFGDVPAVAACLPGASLDQDLGDDHYAGKVGIRMGPVKLAFDGRAHVLSRDDAAKTMVLDGQGAAEGGRGNAAMQLTARLGPAPGGTKVSMDMDLQLSGAAAQYGRGMVADVTKVLMAQFATNMQRRIEAAERGERVDDTARPASGLAIAMSAARLALMRVVRRFFLPFDPAHV
jgi:carbon monoxide dehydrogenase subunit G